MRPTCLALGLLSLAFGTSTAFAQDTTVPKAAQGVWAEGGKCHGETVSITSDTLQYKGAKPEAVYFTPKDSPSGYGVIYNRQEGVVDNFEYADDKDHLIYNPEGFGMGAPVLYKRCH
ncbi:hypothetical protein QBK99_24880 [Corticibacterium sp. UT-5YL-CI-8]|nr:hypothetical protein [Tianweitania sp. UT-5YL-CI-8]